MKALFREMARVQQDVEAKAKTSDMSLDTVFRIKHVLVDGKMVVVYTTLESKSKSTRSFRQIHMFRFKGDKVVEYWDITQIEPIAKYSKNMF